MQPERGRQLGAASWKVGPRVDTTKNFYRFRQTEPKKGCVYRFHPLQGGGALVLEFSAKDARAARD